MKVDCTNHKKSIFHHGFIFLCCLILPVCAYSQMVVITGTVRDEASRKPLYLATVMNKRTGEAIFTDSTGFYRIDAKGRDTISFSFLGFFTNIFVVPQRLERIIHNVDLVPRSQRLSEVEIKALTPYQHDSLDRIETFGEYLKQPTPQFINTHAHSLYDKPDPNYNSSFGLEFPLFPFFSKRGREKRKFGKMYSKFEKEQYINSRYTPELVNRLTGLTGDSLSLFLYEFRPSYELVRTASNLVFWSWIKIQYRSWVDKKEK